MIEKLSVEDDGADRIHHAFEQCIVAGDLVVFPADGLYGVACDPKNEEAVRRIHRLKGRAEGKPSAVMYFSLPAMREILDSLTPLVRAIASALLPGPVTLVIDNPEHRYAIACGENPDRLGVRFIEGPLWGVVVPVFQTSANPSGEPAPARFEDIPGVILDGVELAVDGGELTGKPSTVIDTSEVEAGGPWRVLREGGLSYQDLEKKLTGLSLGG
ncbi:MAG: L-threonylcarbamoyladenylate synthase [Solirubrobacterales bacterium]